MQWAHFVSIIFIEHCHNVKKDDWANLQSTLLLPHSIHNLWWRFSVKGSLQYLIHQCVPMPHSTQTSFTKPYFQPSTMDASFPNTFNHITQHATIQILTSLLVWLFNFWTHTCIHQLKFDCHAEIEFDQCLKLLKNSLGWCRS